MPNTHAELPAFSRRLKAAMAYKNVSVGTLAEQLGVTRQTVSAWRGGNNIPTVKNVTAIERALELPPGDLVQTLTGQDVRAVPERVAFRAEVDTTGLDPEDIDYLQAMADTMRQRRGHE